MVYMNPLRLFRDLWAGLLGLTIRQIRAVWRYSQGCDLLVAVGDIVPIGIAHLTGRPYAAFLVSTSSYYEGRIKLPWLTQYCLRSARCQQIFTRDAYTAADLQRRGYRKALFAGYPIMDLLTPAGIDLQLSPAQPMVALLPGSRLPEALHNLALQLQLCQAISRLNPEVQFRAALVPAIQAPELEDLAQREGWHFQPSPPQLTKRLGDWTTRVYCYNHAFADILHQCQLAIGMAGTAVEQAVGLGKPVIQIPGQGPQFTYRFAEAQMRLLGCSVQTMGTGPATPQMIQQAAQRTIAVLQDAEYRSACLQNGQERTGSPGGSLQIARHLQAWLSP
jgi:uncharacterized protein (TIGR03492 family)